jgi:flagellar motor switch/type III secretory pathway protein FliN
MSDVLPFPLLGDRAASNIESCLSGRINDWLNSWFPADVQCTLNVSRISQPEQNQSRLFTFSSALNQEQYLLFSIARDDLTRFAKKLFDNNEAGYFEVKTQSLVDEILDACLQDLSESILKVLSEDKSIALTSDKEFSDSQKYIEASLSFKEFDIELYLSLAFLSLGYEHVTKKTLDGYEETLKQQKVNITVLLGQVEMTVDMLSQLRKGTVIQMDKKTGCPFNNDSRKYKCRS